MRQSYSQLRPKAIITADSASHDPCCFRTQSTNWGHKEMPNFISFRVHDWTVSLTLLDHWTVSRYVQVTRNIENCLLLAADAITKPSLTMPAELPSIVLLLNRSFVSISYRQHELPIVWMGVQMMFTVQLFTKEQGMQVPGRQTCTHGTIV